MQVPTGLIGFALCLLTATTVGAQEPQACLAEGMEGFRYYGPEDVVDGVERYYPIQITRGEQDYILETYSGTAPAPNRPTEYCLRYEVGNLGDFDVHMLWWEDARLRAALLTKRNGADDVKVRVDIQPSDPAPRAFDSHIHAFENEEEDTVAYRPLTTLPEEQASATKTMPMLRPAWIMIDQLDPVLASYLREVPEGTIKQPFRGMAFPEGSFDAPLLETRYQTGDVSVLHSSEVYREGKDTIVVANTLSISGADGSVPVYAPYLTTLDAFADGTVEEVGKNYPRVQAFIAGPEIKWTELDDNYWEQKHTYSGRAFEAPVLSIVEHPIGIRTDMGVDCIIVSSYGPLPFQLWFDDCPESE